MTRKIHIGTNSSNAKRLSFDTWWRTNGIYYSLIFIFIFGQVFWYFNRSATDMESWDNICTELMLHGKTLYKDFFYYVPPLSLLKSSLIWILFNGSVFSMRLLGILERCILFCLIFKVLAQLFRKQYAFIGTITGYLIYNSLAFNSYGNYTQLCQLLVIAAVLWAMKFGDYAKENNNKQCIKALFISGFLLTQSLMSKQSIGGFSIAFLFLGLLLYVFMIGKAYNLGKYILCVICSFFAGLLPYIIWFLYSGSLKDFWTQVVSSSVQSKGMVAVSSEAVAATSAFSNVINSIFSRYIVIISIAIIIYTLCKRTRKNTKYEWLGRIPLSFGIIYTIYHYNYWKYFSQSLQLIGYLFSIESFAFYFLCILLLLLLSFFLMGAIPQKEKHYIKLAIIILIAMWGWSYLFTLQPEQVKELLDHFELVTFLSQLYELAFATCNAYLLILIVDVFIFKNKPKIEIVFYIFAADANAVISLFGGGDAKWAANGALFTIPLFVVVILENIRIKNPAVKNRNIEINTKTILTGICVFLMSILIMADKIVNPFQFWGWTSEAISDASNYTIDFERYYGMRVPKKTKMVLEQTTKLVTQNTSENDFIFTFPYSVIYNILAERYEIKTFSPVHYFDVCPDSYAILDAEILENNPPELIIWKDMGDACWEFNEQSYRNGAPSGQRKIQAWYDEVKEKDYTLVGQIYNLSIYLRNDLPIRYTYFAQENDLASNPEETITNIYRSNILNNISNKLNLRNIIKKSIYYELLFTLAVITIISAWKIKSWWKISTLFILLLGFASNLSYVYYFVLAVPLFTSILSEQTGLLARIQRGGILINIMLLFFFWDPLWNSLIKYIFYCTVSILFILILLDGYIKLIRDWRNQRHDTID